MFSAQLLSPANPDLRSLSSCKQSSTVIKDVTMATDPHANKATVREFFGAIERRDFKAFDLIVVENYAHNIQDMPMGRESLKSYFSALCKSIPDLTMPILDLISEGDTVMVRNRVRGTHLGDFGPLKATGKTFDIAAFHLYRLKGGRLVEHFEVVDMAALQAHLRS
jgi:predicted ester cyclase